MSIINCIPGQPFFTEDVAVEVSGYLSREDAGNGLNYHALRPIRLKTWILLSRGPEPGCSSEFTLKRSQE